MKKPLHPGRIVRNACINALGKSVSAAAKALGVSRPTLSNLVNEHAGVSPEMAIRLEKAGWSTADTWVRMQAAYDLAVARAHEDDIMVERIEKEPVGAH